MKGVPRYIIVVLLVILCQGCVMICPSKPHAVATGKIEGKVVDVKGMPVAGAEVTAIYLRGWTTWFPPVPNGFVAGSAVADNKGRFLIITKKRVDALSASSSRNRGMLEGVHQDGNCIILKP